MEEISSSKMIMKEHSLTVLCIYSSCTLSSPHTPTTVSARCLPHTHTYYSECVVHCCHPSRVGCSAGVVATVTPLDGQDGEEWSLNSNGGSWSDKHPILPESDVQLSWVTRNWGAVEDKHSPQLKLYISWKVTKCGGIWG